MLLADASDERWHSLAHALRGHVPHASAYAYGGRHVGTCDVALAYQLREHSFRPSKRSNRAYAQPARTMPNIDYKHPGLGSSRNRRSNPLLQRGEGKRSAKRKTTRAEIYASYTSHPLRLAPVFLATSATILPATASISASVKVLSRGCKVTPIATDFLPSGMPLPS